MTGEFIYFTVSLYLCVIGLIVRNRTLVVSLRTHFLHANNAILLSYESLSLWHINCYIIYKKYIEVEGIC